jgi:hypothetical protein
VEIVVLGGDPVWTCLTEWIRRGKTSQAFSAAWESASRGEGELADIYRAATTVAPVAEVVRQLSGEEHALFSNAESRPFIEEKGASIRLTLCREENMHLLVERLRRNAGETEVEARTMDRVRHIDRAKLVAHHCEGVGGIEISSSSVSPACGAEWPSMVFSGQDRQALVAKWSVRPNGDDSLVYVFPHIPKTAGSSVHYHLKTNMAYDSEYIHIPIDNTTNEELRMRTPFTLRDERDRVRAKILFGHGVIRRHAEFVPGKRVREIVTLRDPVERTLSHYNFWMNVLEKRGDQPMDFDQWYAGEPRNYHVNWIAKNYLEVGDDLSPADAFSTAKEALENFWMVCTLPTFERDIQRLWAALDLPPMQLRQNVGGVTHEKRLECDDALRQRLIEENSFDHELYLLWVERNRAADIPTLQPA